MPIISVTRDAESLTMTIVGEFDAPVRRLWVAYLVSAPAREVLGAASM